jgi:protein TonB
MAERPLLGIGLSLALHAAVFALVVAGLSRGDQLDALVIDLRDGFVPSTAPVGFTTRGDTPAAGGTPSAPPSRRSTAAKSAPGPARSEPAPAPLVDNEPLRSRVDATPAPAPPVDMAVEPSRPVSPAPPAEVAVEAFRPMSSSPPAMAESAPQGPPAPLGAVAAGGGAGRDEGKGTEGATSAARVSSAGAGRDGQGAGDGDGTARGGRPGQTLALATSGAGTGVAPEYGPYLTALRQRVQQSLRYPASARRRGIGGTVNVEILIHPNGTVGDVTLLDSSTHEVLDAAALDAIRSLPRMPLPPDVPTRPLRIRIPVVFQMR